MQVSFYQHGTSFVSFILYKSAFMDLKLSDISQYLNHGTILLKAVGGGIPVFWTHIYLALSFPFSSFFFFFLFLAYAHPQNLMTNAM